MLQRILLPLDGSPLAERALTYATQLARRSNATIELIHAAQTHVAPDVQPTTAQLEATNVAHEYLTSVVDRLGAQGVLALSHVSPDDPVPAILAAAERYHPDLIVMSTHGRGGLSRVLYGSVADQVVRRATVPVLLVPSIVEHAWPADGPLSLLLPLDGSELAEEALGPAALLTEARGSRLTLLQVVQPPTYPLYGDGYTYVPFDEDAELADARAYLGRHAARLGAGGEPVTTVVQVGEPARVIGEIARAQDMDVVVMATHGKGGLSRLILGSVATGTLRHTTVPLLLVRPAAMPRAEPLPDGAAAADQSLTTAYDAVAAHEPAVTLRLSLEELELVERGLKALGYAPGYDYGHVLAARALAERLRATAQAEAVQPVAAG